MLDNEILEISKTKNDYILDCRWRVPKKIQMTLISIIE